MKSFSLYALSSLVLSTNAMELAQIAQFEGIVAEGFEFFDQLGKSVEEFFEGGVSSTLSTVATSSSIASPTAEAPLINDQSKIVTSPKVPILTFSGDSVCDVFTTNLTIENSETLKDQFETDVSFYVSQNSSLPDYYYLDFFLKNPNYEINEFNYVNVSNNVKDYNPVYISTQGDYGFELRFLTVQNKLCSFLEDFYVFYELNNTISSETSHKIWVTGNCSYVESNNPTVYDVYINEGYRCVDYNNGNGEENWCSTGFESDQCCATYENDEFIDDNSCPVFSSTNTTSSISLTTPTFVPDFKGYTS